MIDHARDALRTACLVLDSELLEGVVSDADVAEIAAGAAARRRDLAGWRLLGNVQRLGMKLGLIGGLASILEDAIIMRRLASPLRDESSPRFLVRVDEFPYSGATYDAKRYGVEATREFHEVLASEGVPYLMAILPRPAIDYLDPRARGVRTLDRLELELIERMRLDGVEFAQHGATHRTRFRSPRRHSELCGLDSVGLRRLLGDARRELVAHGIETAVFVPPFNRFDKWQWPDLAGRYDVITGGPESVRLIGARSAPVWWGEAVYLPCYPPLYAEARTVLAALDEVMRIGQGCWVPIVLHTAWEIDDGFVSLRQLAQRLARHTVRWSEFLEAVERSRHFAA